MLFTNTYFTYILISVGNKNDDPERKVVITEDAQRFARQMDIELFETSAKDNINVEEMFLSITRQVLNHKLQTNALNAMTVKDTIQINKKHKNMNRAKNCCR